MTKRAAIYVRVSSEVQAEKASPQAQEDDCRALCQQRGYLVVDVYRDTERYRVGKRMVEPSGTRHDRPQLKRMLTDAGLGAFDVIVAWREDRLYRSYRPMLDVLECIERHKLTIELAKDHFDPSIAPVKAWAAKIELDAKRERQIMGMAGRFSAGKVWPRCVPFGYRVNGDAVEPDPDAAAWVAKIYQWYADGVAIREIRRRLVAANVPQKYRKPEKDGAPWKLSSIKSILRNECYHAGYQTIKWAGNEHRLPYPALISNDLARRATERKRQNKAYPARHIRLDYLGGGLVHCAACGVRMAARTVTEHQTKNDRKYTYTRGKYRCNDYMVRVEKPGCARALSASRIDAELWAKAWKVISDDNMFNQIVAAKVEALRAQEIDAEAEVSRLTRILDDLAMERQRVITLARKKLITESDLELQLGGMAFQELSLKKELEEKAWLVGNHAEVFLEHVNELRRELQEGREVLNAEFDDPELQKQQFALRRRVVETIVRRVNVRADRSVEVVMEFEALPALNQSSLSHRLVFDSYRVTLTV